MRFLGWPASSRSAGRTANPTMTTSDTTSTEQGLFSPQNAWMLLSLAVSVAAVLALGQAAEIINYPKTLAYTVTAVIAVDYQLWTWGLDHFNLKSEDEPAPSHERLYTVVGGILGATGGFVLGRALSGGSVSVAVGGAVVLLLGLFLLATATQQNGRLL